MQKPVPPTECIRGYFLVTVTVGKLPSGGAIEDGFQDFGRGDASERPAG